MAKTKKNTGKESEKQYEEDKLYAFIAYLLSIVGFLIVMVSKKKNAFAWYHAKQSLVLFFLMVIANTLSWLIGWIPVTGQIIKAVVSIFCLVLWIIGIINALQHKQKPLPFIGPFAENLNI